MGEMTAKPGSCLPTGETGRVVAANVERLRLARGLSLRQLAVRLGEFGHPMLPSAVHVAVRGKRRIDVDDLAAFAAVLEVSAADLLMPYAAAEASAGIHPAMRETRNLAGRIGEALASPGDPVSARRLDRALTRVRVEVEELLEETASQEKVS